MKIGDIVTFKIFIDLENEVEYMGKITDVFELGFNETVFEVTTESGVFNVDSNIVYIV